MVKTGNTRNTKASGHRGGRQNVPAQKSVRASSLPALLGRYLHESVDGLSLIIENASVSDLEIDAGALSFIGIGASSLSNVGFRNFCGNLHISGAMGRMVSNDLSVCDSQIGRFISHQAHYSSCRFVSTDIGDLGAAPSAFRNCVFDGRIVAGVFMPLETPGRANSEDFTGNDFSACDLGDVDFRGGINLSEQTFTEEQLALVIWDAPAMLERLNSYRGRFSATPGFVRLRELIRRSVKEMRQQQIYVSRSLARSFLFRYLTDFERDWEAISLDFARWARAVRDVALASR